MDRPIFQGVASSRALVWFAIAALLIAILIEKSGMDARVLVDGISKEDPEQYRTEYVGDAPKVVGIVSNLSYPEGYSYESIEIKSQNEPYELTVFLKVDDDANAISEADLQTAADSTFELIGNLGKLEFRSNETKDTIASFAR